MNHYIFNVAMLEDAERALASGVWEVERDERHAHALAPGDVALIYLAATARVFIGRAEIASSVRAEATRCNVVVRKVERWDPPVPMASVLANIGPSGTAKADFDAGVVLISPSEYEAALAAAAAESARVE